jgi:ABC-type multidrug transport system ATPase subunit
MLNINKIKLFSNSDLLVSFTVSLGNGLHVDGIAGSGKTKLFKICTGILRPISGDVIYNNVSIYNSDFIDLSLTRKMIGAIFETPVILSNLNLKQNIEFILKSRMKPWSKHVDELVKLYGLENILNLRKINLSRDEVIRFNFLKIILSNPKIIFMDEVSLTNTISINRHFLKWLKVNKNNFTIVFFGHYPKELDFMINDRVNISGVNKQGDIRHAG